MTVESQTIGRRERNKQEKLDRIMAAASPCQEALRISGEFRSGGIRSSRTPGDTRPIRESAERNGSSLLR